MATITSPRATSPAATPRITSPSIASPLSTPTSSVRPSLELPRPTDATQPPTNQRPRNNNRAALRDYYNLKSRGASTPPTASSALARTASISSATSDTSQTPSTATTTTLNNDTSPLLTQLDSPSFDAQSFITHLLQTSSLRDILRTESALVSEIRTLDGERKALVYDNYSKLIKAVGTIGDMQKGMQRRQEDPAYGGLKIGEARQADAGGVGLEGVEALQEKLHGLEAEVRELRSGDGETEEGKRYEEEVERRRKVKGQRDLVRWVLGAPERLKGLENREDAEMEWARVKMLLNRWEGVKGVEEVRRKGEEVMKRRTVAAREERIDKDEDEDNTEDT